MNRNPINPQTPIASWHRNLLVAAAVFTTLLIAMGGVLCVTQSIRNCPDWPGCFGRVVPPMEAGAIMEVMHRLLAAVSGLLIVGSAIAGLIHSPRSRWLAIPPLIALALVVEVSIFGALVVLYGLAPGWATVDVGSALLVVAIMVATATIASTRKSDPSQVDRLEFHSPFARLALVTALVVYIVQISGIPVAGKNSVTACLGWPIYSPGLFQIDTLDIWNYLRIAFSIAGIFLVITVLANIWRWKVERPEIYRLARWLGLALLIEASVQILLLIFALPVSLLLIYTVTAAAFWALLVALLVRIGLLESQRQSLAPVSSDKPGIQLEIKR